MEKIVRDSKEIWVYGSEIFDIDFVFLHESLKDILRSNEKNGPYSISINMTDGSIRHFIFIPFSLIKGTKEYNFVLNHEIGHIVLGHTTEKKFAVCGNPKLGLKFNCELEADAYSYQQTGLKLDLSSLLEKFIKPKNKGLRGKIIKNLFMITFKRRAKAYEKLYA